MLYSIQYLRAVAAILVVMLHATLQFAKISPEAPIFGVGAAGVDIFFVISGFIIYHIGLKLHGKPVLFLARRAARIIPIYWLYTSIYLLGMLAFPASYNKGSSLEHIIASFLFIPYHHPTEDIIAPALLPGWTLNYEMFFYACFAGVLLLRKEAVVGALALAFCLLMLLRALFDFDNAILQVYTSPLLLEFMFGLFIAHAWPSIKIVNTMILVPVAALAIVMLTCLQPAPQPIDAWSRAIFWGVPAAMLVFVAVAIEHACKIRRLYVLKLLGDASYSLYLSHVISLPLFTALWMKAGLGANVLVFLLSGLTLSIIVSIVSYVIVERPVTNWLNGRIDTLAGALSVTWRARRPAPP